MNSENKIDQILEHVVGLTSDVSVLKQDVSVLKKDVSGLKGYVSLLQEDVSVLKKDTSMLKQIVTRMDARAAKVDHVMAGLYQEKHWLSLEVDDIKRRLDKLEDSRHSPS